MCLRWIARAVAELDKSSAAQHHPVHHISAGQRRYACADVVHDQRNWIAVVHALNVFAVQMLRNFMCPAGDAALIAITGYALCHKLASIRQGLVGQLPVLICGYHTCAAREAAKTKGQVRAFPGTACKCRSGLPPLMDQLLQLWHTEQQNQQQFGPAGMSRLAVHQLLSLWKHLWRLWLKAAPCLFLLHMVRLGGPMLQQVQRCITLLATPPTATEAATARIGQQQVRAQAASDGGSSSSRSSSWWSLIITPQRTCAIATVQLQQYAVGVARFCKYGWPDPVPLVPTKRESLQQFHRSDAVAEVGLQQLSVCCRTLRKLLQVEQQMGSSSANDNNSCRRLQQQQQAAVDCPQ